ncbi:MULTISPECIES: signal peptidase I [Streptomyces]|uniref:signal peptidase I n=1 Tax=Streptomyces TaxID=1883 RepID=UPI001E457875|nr:MULTISPECIES: signal peptidase I [Streptomyces]UFQ18576.1 signal peptidase I [Streptomyces huasconensis]WCL88191.1 signal peptidase I [Streptomyces sp. JCM 35825]
MARRAFRATMTLLVTALALGALAAGIAWLAYGVRFVPVLTPSMRPGMPPGSLAVTRPLAPEDIRTGQVLVFRPPQPWTPKDDRPVLHRVTAIEQYAAGRVLTTKGDANPGPDPWKVDLSGSGEYARVVAVVPHVGTVAKAAHQAGPVALGGALLGLYFLGWGARRLVPRSGGRHNRGA